MSVPPRIAALVLAAGYSSRMGYLKLLASLGASTLIEEAVSRFIEAGITDVRVVVGHRADEIIPVLDRLGVRWIKNDRYELGMFSSILAGVKSLETEIDGIFLLPADIPLVKPGTIRALRDAFNRHDPRIVYPRFDGQRGHPPLIPAAYLRQDLPSDYPGGLRSFLERYEKDAIDLDIIDENILLDCDTQSDYRALVQRRTNEDIPTEAECESIWRHLNVPEKVVAHSAMVAEVARLLAVHLNLAGLSLNIPLILAAGKLHDIARDRPNHAEAGARILSEMGCPRVGEIVAKHMDIHSRGPSVDEADLIYLADKYVEENSPVSLEERFGKALSRYADRPEVKAKIGRRLENAKSIASRIEAIVCRSPEDLIKRHERNLRAASAGFGRSIYIVRHGAIQSSSESKRFIGQTDLPLNAEGVQQAVELAEALQHVPLSAVFCSNLKRSVSTAQIIAGPHGLPFIQEPELREIALGDWEGLTFDEVRTEHPEDFRQRGIDIVNFRPPGGESFLDCTLRILPAFYRILNSTRGPILIVGHAGVNRIILTQALGRPLEALFEIGQEYGCINVVSYRFPELGVKLLNRSPSGVVLPDEAATGIRNPRR